MNHTVNLVQRLLIQGRNLQQLGLDEKAVSILTQLSHFRDLPSEIATETHLRLTALHSSNHKYARARRHLAVVMAHRPHSPRCEFRMARLSEKDTQSDPRKALLFYRRILKQQPKNPRFLSSFGMFALRNGKERTALGALRRAFRLAPDCRLVLKRYIKVLTQLHRFKEARRVLRSCRFRLTKQQWFQTLYRDFRFLMLQRKQRQNKRQQVQDNASEFACVLPFPHEERKTASANSEYVRSDRPSVLPAPHLPLRLHRPDQRYAQ